MNNVFEIKKILAFTLAEVLITLGIIGIVAAITISTIINNSNDIQTKTGVKEAYAILSQAMANALNDNGGNIAGACTDFDNRCFKNLIKQSLSYSKDCDTNSIANGCWASMKNYDGSPYNIPNSYSALTLKNGMLILFRFHNQNCTYTDANSTNYKCGWIATDINGFKGPNTTGKDIFIFNAQNGKILPMGLTGDVGNMLTCNGTETGDYSGWGCTSKYLYN